MTLTLRNRWDHKGGQWWEWEAFLDDAGSGELENVERVEYVLHPTFRDPIREVTFPEGGFLMRTAGWGTFPLKAFVYLRNGQKLKLTHEIELFSDPPRGISGARPPSR